MKYKTLGAITNCLDSRRIPLNSIQRKKLKNNPVYPYFGANNILDYIDDYIFDEKILCIAEDGGSWGYNQICAFMVNEKCWVNNHAHVLTTKPGYSLEYIYYYVNLANLTKHITGTTRGKLTRKELDKIKIPIPETYADQVRIANVLSRAEELIAKRKESITLLDELLKSTFLDMFGDPVRNEKSWSIKKLVELTKLITDGKHGNCEDEADSGYYFISAKDIHDNIIDYSFAREITKKDFLEVHKRTNFQVGDLVIVNTGATIGKMAIANDTRRTHRTTFQKSVAVIKCIRSKLNKRYLQFLLNVRLSELVKVSSGSAQKNLLLSQMRKIPILLPPLSLQNKFAEIVEKVENLKAVYNQSLSELENLYGSLSQRAFKGELDLSRMEIELEDVS